MLGQLFLFVGGPREFMKSVWDNEQLPRNGNLTEFGPGIAAKMISDSIGNGKYSGI